MFAMTPFERRDYDLFDMLDGFDRGFFAPPAPHGKEHIRTDIRDEGDKFVMEAELPGFAKEDIALDITDNMLTLTAEHKEEKSEKDEKGKYIRRERRVGSYKRSFDLTGISTDNITAEYRNGILYIDLPKQQIEPPKSRRLEIAAKD
ncbi:MAG: Hsp20/alpha crystallin family protein [Ruminococcus sp.]|nr:Hsp20/alpha crystallin family protein [Ruminococcus sp.]